VSGDSLPLKETELQNYDGNGQKNDEGAMKRSRTSGTSRNKASLFLQEGEEGDLEKILLLPSLLLVHQQGKQCRNPGYSLPQKVRRGVLTMRVKEEDALSQFPEENDELGTKNQKITTEKTKTTMWSFSKLQRKRT
jgi:hypothetical protein